MKYISPPVRVCKNIQRVLGQCTNTSFSIVAGRLATEIFQSWWIVTLLLKASLYAVLFIASQTLTFLLLLSSSFRWTAKKIYCVTGVFFYDESVFSCFSQGCLCLQVVCLVIKHHDETIQRIWRCHNIFLIFFEIQAVLWNWDSSPMKFTGMQLLSPRFHQPYRLQSFVFLTLKQKHHVVSKQHLNGTIASNCCCFESVVPRVLWY